MLEPGELINMENHLNFAHMQDMLDVDPQTTGFSCFASLMAGQHLHCYHTITLQTLIKLYISIFPSKTLGPRIPVHPKVPLRSGPSPIRRASDLQVDQLGEGLGQAVRHSLATVFGTKHVAASKIAHEGGYGMSMCRWAMVEGLQRLAAKWSDPDV